MYDYVTQGYNTLTSDYLLDGNGITVEGPMEITIPANGSYDGKLKITLDDDAKAYFDQTFANGNFFEGYVYFENQNPGAASDSPVAAGILGDANLDNKVTAADAAEILRAVVGLTELDPVAMFFADVNQDGDVTAADAAFILRAVVGLEVLPTYTPTAKIASADAHFTFSGFYGDWTQGPVLDRVWTNSPAYLMYFAAENVYYPQYAAAGYLPTDLFTPMEVNILPHMTYGMNYYENYLYNLFSELGIDPSAYGISSGLYTYFATNPACTIIGDDEANALAWEDVLNTFDNPLHNAISNENTDGIEFLVDTFYSEPIQLRNARHLIMTVTDAVTGEVYYVDDTEYLGKVYYSNDYGRWIPRGSFQWDGYVYNEDSDLYGQYVPNGTICLVTYEAMIDYPGAELNTEYQFQLLVDTEAPVITGFELTDNTATVQFADNGSGMSFVDAYCYDGTVTIVEPEEEGEEPTAKLTSYDLGYAVGEDCGEVVFDLSEVPEGVSYILLESIDYATNIQYYALNLETGEITVGGYDYLTVAFAVDQIFNHKGAIGTNVAVEGIVTEIYDDIVYVSEMEPVYGNPQGMAIKLADKEALEDIAIGDVYIFVGELDNYYGCPTLDNAAITYTIYINEYADYGYVGAAIYDNIIDGYIDYSLSWGDPIAMFADVVDNPELYAGALIYTDYNFEMITVIGVTEIGDGTRTISVTDGYRCIDIVATSACEDVQVGDTLYYGYFVPVFDHGVAQLRVFMDYAIEFTPAE